MLDLFSGAGGLTSGFHRHGFHSVLAIEHDAAAAKSYQANFPGAYVEPRGIEYVDDFPEAEIIVGGPPCQGFSPLGKNRDATSRAEMNELWRHFVRAVRRVRPKVFLIENVPQFLRSAQFEAFLQVFASDPALADYALDYRVLMAADYGVPQRRRRGVVVGSRVGEFAWPRPSHGPDSPGGRPFRTVRDAIGDLPLEPTGEDLHVGRNPRPSSIERYKAVPEGGNRFDLARNRPDLLPDCWARKKSGTTDVFGRLWWDRPSLTIRTEFYKPEKGRYLHPQAHRPITHREAARLQSFPDSFDFVGSKIEIARQIGNAVPPRLANVLARRVRALLQ